MKNDETQTALVRRRFALTVLYGLLLLVPAVFGTVLSFGAQRGGIGQLNAFIAPLLGPWSPILPPNSQAVSEWTPRYTAFAQCLTAILVFSIAGSYLAQEREVRYGAIALSCLGLIIWALAGLGKVVLEMA